MLKWIIGDFATGNIKEADVLPTINNSGDKIEIDVNANESAVLTVSLKDLPSDWRSYLRPPNKMVALIEDTLAWGSSVLWAGWINKTSATVNGTVSIQAVGLREYMAVRSSNDMYNTKDTTPGSGYTISSSDDRGLMLALMDKCFSTTGIPSNAPKPPQVLRSLSLSSGTTKKQEIELADGEFFANLMDDWRDNISDNGNEYWFAPSWDSSAKTKIRWTGNVATDSVPHRNENNTITVKLGEEAWKPLSFNQAMSSDNMVSRIIGQSKAGDEDGNKPADLNSKTTTRNTTILIDQFWNPGVELTAAQMEKQMTDRLNYNSNIDRSASFTRAYNDIAELREVMASLGSMVTFSGAGASAYFGSSLRFTGLTFYPGKRVIDIDLAPKAARYKRLPKKGKLTSITDNFSGGNTNTGRKKKDTYDSRNPIKQTYKPGSNNKPKPTKPKPPPFTSENDRDDLNEEFDKGPLKLDKVRVFGTQQEAAELNGDKDLSGDEKRKYMTKSPVPGKLRYNKDTGEIIGISRAGVGGYQLEDANRYIQLIISSYNIDDVFESSSNKYPDSISSEKYNKIVGVITNDQLKGLAISESDFTAAFPGIPVPGYTHDFNFFCDEDHKNIYIQVLTVRGRVHPDSNNTVRSYFLSKITTFKGVRKDNGKVEGFEVISPISIKGFDYNLFSSEIHQINGQWWAFGGYRMMSQQSGFASPGFSPDYGYSFYSQNFFKIDNNLSLAEPIQISMRGEGTGTIQARPLESFNDLSVYNVPLAVRVDKDRKKLTIGYNNGKNDRSIFFESHFNQLDDLTDRIMDTKRIENAFFNPSGSYEDIGFVTSNRYDAIKSGDAVQWYENAGTETPVGYKNDYFFISGRGRPVTPGSSYYDGLMTTKPSLGGGIKLLRGKVGYPDIVKSEFIFPPNTASDPNPFSDRNIPTNSNGESVSYSWGIKINESTFTNSAKLKAFKHFYIPTTGSSTGFPTEKGLHFFERKGYIYCIVRYPYGDVVASYWNSDITNAGSKGAYWLMRFKIDEEKLYKEVN